MDRQWQEDEPLGPVLSGDLGGDEQVSDSWCRRFTLPAREDGAIPMLTISYYVALENPNAENDKRVLLRRHFEYLLCTDAGDPGGTEVWSEYGYGRAPLPWQATERDARRACDEMEAPTLADWDGTEQHGTERARAVNAAARA